MLYFTNNKKYDTKIVAWCSYCKSEIKENEDYIKVNGDYFHLDCFKQKNTYFDDLDYGKEI